MRVPVRLGVTAPAAPGVRRAAYYVPARRGGVHSYGGDVRDVDPFALVFRGNMGARLAEDLEFVATWPSDAAPAIDSSGFNLGLETQQFNTSWLDTYEAPAVQYVPTSDILRTEAAGGLYPGGAVIEEQPRTVLPGQIFGSESAPSSSTQWFQAIPAIATAGAAIATATARVVGSASPSVRYVTPTGQVVAGTPGQPITYTIPATATAPAQRVTYNPATGQITSVPLTAAASMLPSVLQGAPGAAWYQQPLVWVGGGVGLLMLVLLAGGKR